MADAVAGCRVWWEAAPFDLDGAVDLLDAIELGRRARYRRPADRDRFTAAAALLRRAVAVTVGGVDPAAIGIDRTCPSCGEPHGRPRVLDHDLDVSVSHAGAIVAVAASTVGRVGIDVEPITEVDRAVVEVACAEEERPWVHDGRSFHRLWTRKEAVLKALGTGLAIDPSSVVTGPPDAPSTGVRVDGAPIACRVLDVELHADHAAAIAVLTADDVRPVVAAASSLRPPAR